MADINITLKHLFSVEFSNRQTKFLHKNPTENYFTLGGISQKANPLTLDWNFVHKIVSACEDNVFRASKMLYNDDITMNQVKAIYYNNYWLKMKLDKIKSQKIADEIMLMGVVGGTKTAVKLAQKTVGVIDDGIVGDITIKALNDYDEDLFDIEYDKNEVKHFEALVENREQFAIYLNGWKNRAVAV